MQSCQVTSHPYILIQVASKYELELELENCLFDKKKIQTWHNITQNTWQYVFFLSGDPYKGAERTACVRATHGYYNA